VLWQDSLNIVQARFVQLDLARRKQCLHFVKTLAPERGPTSTLGRRTTHVCGVVEFAGDEHRLLRERARKAGCPLAVYIREAALGVQLARVANRSAYRELTRVGTNQNQLARWANTFRCMPDLGKLHAVLDELLEVRRKL